MAENVDYNRFKLMVPQPGDRLDRIENFLVPGMPDINFCSQGMECWIEQKSPKEPIRPTTPLFGSNHRVSQDQMNWFLRQTRAHGRCWFLITTNKRWLLIDGRLADQINKMTVDRLIFHADWHELKPVSKESWIDLWDALRQ